MKILIFLLLVYGPSACSTTPKSGEAQRYPNPAPQKAAPADTAKK